MNPPYYTVTVASLTRGWSYTTTDGDVPDPDNLDPVYLADELTVDWGFKGDLVPGQLDPSVLKFRFYTRDADDVPLVDRGDLLTVDVRIGTVGSRIAAPAPFAVTEVLVDVDEELVLDPDVYACTVQVTAVDSLSYLLGEFVPGVNPISPYATSMFLWRPQWAQLARQVGRTIACPTWWGEQEGPLYPLTAAAGHFQNVTGVTMSWDGNGAAIVERQANSHQPGAITHTLTPGYSATPSSFPAGYRRIGPDLWWGDNDFQQPAWALVEPQTSLRYYMQPASRKTSDGDLPLRLVVAGGRLTVEPNPVSTSGSTRGHSRGAIDSAWIDLPISLRRAREHRVNVARVLGWEGAYASGGGTPAARASARESYDLNDLANRGVASARDIPTHLYFGEVPFGTNPSFDVLGREHPFVGANFLGDTSADQAWVYDEFTLFASRIPQAYATDLLSHLTPRYPGETDGDGHVLRHVTIYRPSPRVRMVDAPGMVRGFITSGRLKLVAGDIEFRLTLTPGLPQRTSTAPTPVTFAEFEAVATAAGLTIDQVDPLISYDDLDYIDA